MKKTVLALIVCFSMLSFLSAAKGGFGPCLATCCFGPRVGLELNEGTDLRKMEIYGLIGQVIFAVNVDYFVSPVLAATGKSMNDEKKQGALGGPLIKAAAPTEKGGIKPFLAGCCLGPRIGLELNDGRKIRTSEYLYIIPIANVFMLATEAIDAYKGVTMTEIAVREGLDK